MDVRNPSIVLHYRHRADSLFCAARDLSTLNADLYGPALGVIAVHGAIALADALLVACEGDRSRCDDHREAARRIRSWCSAKRIAEAGIKHFEWLIDKKTHFSYDDRRVEPYDLQMAKVKMDQFFAWAFSTFPAIAQMKETSDA
ncbi:MAG: hypothetical protein HY898_05185 [Deltaproteobacteria bacterium]|nr:hypothetical protein [Deltaproteobacteria bacterium]